MGGEADVRRFCHASVLFVKSIRRGLGPKVFRLSEQAPFSKSFPQNLCFFWHIQAKKEGFWGEDLEKGARSDNLDTFGPRPRRIDFQKHRRMKLACENTN